jgi:hypothetical protein
MERGRVEGDGLAGEFGRVVLAAAKGVSGGLKGPTVFRTQLSEGNGDLILETFDFKEP